MGIVSPESWSPWIADGPVMEYVPNGWIYWQLGKLEPDKQ